MATARSDIAFLYRRAGFGASPAQLDAVVAGGYDAAVDALLGAGTRAGAGPDPEPPPTFAPLPKLADVRTDPQARSTYAQMVREQGTELTGWWVRRMVATADPFTEKLTFFWHGHFATSITKVRVAAAMLAQNEIFRRSGTGPFDALTLAVARDPAMLAWLDAGQNRKEHPNENFSRELMELFTLGIGNYTEIDVREAARAFTGWRVDASRTGFQLAAKQHDDGTKTVLAKTGNLGGEDVIALVTHQPASARWVCSRLFSRLAAPVAPDANPAADAMLAAYGSTLDAGAAVRAMLRSPAFLASRGKLVAQPVEYVVTTLRALGLRVTPTAGGSADASTGAAAGAGGGALPQRAVLAALAGLGQVPFQPPSVGGWPENAAWLTTASTQVRTKFATAAAAAANLAAIADEPAAGRPDAVAHLLSLDGWTSRTREAMSGAGGNPARLVALALLSPEYLTV
ncbi:DUF1800 domain-containing protein [Pseudofrankia sp. BMG5.36]|uniref:DUF1800 domain-containing protein n=1 Tax=Pseudofrankia sp. BMG5.36 TaxID=1834512 RepID=UPI0008DA79BD|nr:DUF1800 domain-containing protein [Pseudofrankia sp. BMG5.36]OHV47903.1 hypothetical protein BCD48_17150 [Pseudofrankia sp. BMG5.36]